MGILRWHGDNAECGSSGPALPNVTVMRPIFRINNDARPWISTTGHHLSDRCAAMAYLTTSIIRERRSVGVCNT